MAYRGGDEEASVGMLRVQLSTNIVSTAALESFATAEMWWALGWNQGETRASQHPGRGVGWASMPASARAEQRRRARALKWSNPQIHQGFYRSLKSAPKLPPNCGRILLGSNMHLEQ